MQLKNIGEFPNLPQNHPFSTLKIWEQSIYEIDQMKAISSYNLLKLQCGRDRARMLFEQLTAECLKEYVLGRVSDHTLAHFELPPDIKTPEDIIETLKHFTLSERAAILYAAAEGVHIRNALTLTWAEVQTKKHTTVGAQLLRSRPRHLSCSLVFWNMDGDTILPLLRLEADLLEMFKLPWAEIDKLLCQFPVHIGNVI